MEWHLNTDLGWHRAFYDLVPFCGRQRQNRSKLSSFSTNPFLFPLMRRLYLGNGCQSGCQFVPFGEKWTFICAIPSILEFWLNLPLKPLEENFYLNSLYHKCFN